MQLKAEVFGCETEVFCLTQNADLHLMNKK